MLICPYVSFFLQPTLPSSSHQHSTDPALIAFALSDPVVPILSSSRSLALAQLTTPSFSCSLFSWTSQHDVLLGFCILFWLPSLSVSLSLSLSFFFFTPLLLDHFQNFEVSWSYIFSLDDLMWSHDFKYCFCASDSQMYVSSPALSLELQNQVKLTHIPAYLIDDSA